LEAPLNKEGKYGFSFIEPVEGIVKRIDDPVQSKEEIMVKLRRALAGCILACLATAPAFLQSQTPGYSPLSPAAVGARVETVIQCGGEPCDARIFLLEVVRGEKAWQRIKAAGSSNTPPKGDLEYVLARMRFEMSARTPGSKSYQIRSGQTGQFLAFSAEGQPYEAPALALPKPELEGTLRSGESIEGWLAFAVPKSEGKPLMNFDPASGAARGQGKLIWFRLQ
jgi:hypothetical protein